MKPETITCLRHACADGVLGHRVRELLDEHELLLSSAKQLLHTIVLREGDAAITGPGIFGMRAAIAKAES